MELLDILKHRHSIRQYTEESISEDQLEKILQAGLLSASGRNRRPWELIVIRDKKTLKTLAACRAGGSRMLEGANSAVVVIADPEKSDTWIEDCSIVMANMHLAADSLGVGSCWIQGRLREAQDGRSTEEYLRAVLQYPKEYRLQAILSLGMPGERKAPTDLQTLPVHKIHWDTY